MAKRQAVILSVTLEGLTQAEAARRFEVSESYVSRLMARFRVEGDAAFEVHSRRPRSSPTATPDKTVELIVDLRVKLIGKGLDAGPVTIVWHLAQHHGIKVSVATVRRRLLDAGLIVAEPKKRPRTSYVRFEAELPNSNSTPSPTSTTTADPTAPSAEPPRPPPTSACPKPAPPAPMPGPTTASATTGSTPAAWSRSDTAAACTTSALAARTPPRP